MLPVDGVGNPAETVRLSRLAEATKMGDCYVSEQQNLTPDHDMSRHPRQVGLFPVVGHLEAVYTSPKRRPHSLSFVPGGCLRVDRVGVPTR